MKLINPEVCGLIYDSDKLFVIITQIGKVGNLIEIRRDIAQKDDPSSSVYNIRYYLLCWFWLFLYQHIHFY